MVYVILIQIHAYFLTLKIHNNVFSPLISSRCQDVILSYAIKTVIRSVVTCIMHLTTFKCTENKQEITLSNLHHLEFRMKSH